MTFISIYGKGNRKQNEYIYLKCIGGVKPVSLHCVNSQQTGTKNHRPLLSEKEI